jgi:RNA polymerase sigma factor (sigma-70 family)
MEKYGVLNPIGEEEGLMSAFTFDSDADRLLVNVLQFEPVLRSYLRRTLKPHPQRVEECLSRLYVRILSVGEQPPQTVEPLRSFAFRILQEVLRDVPQWTRLDSRSSTAMDLVPHTDVPGEPPSKAPAVANTSSRALSGSRLIRADCQLSIEEQDEINRLMRKVAKLPKQTRRVCTLRKVYQLSTSEIASRLNLPVAKVEEHLRRSALAAAQELYDPDI